MLIGRVEIETDGSFEQKWFLSFQARLGAMLQVTIRDQPTLLPAKMLTAHGLEMERVGAVTCGIIDIRERKSSRPSAEHCTPSICLMELPPVQPTSVRCRFLLVRGPCNDRMRAVQAPTVIDPGGDGSAIRKSEAVRELFPAPVRPTIPTFSPARTVNVMSMMQVARETRGRQRTHTPASHDQPT